MSTIIGREFTELHSSTSKTNRRRRLGALFTLSLDWMNVSHIARLAVVQQSQLQTNSKIECRWLSSDKVNVFNRLRCTVLSTAILITHSVDTVAGEICRKEGTAIKHKIFNGETQGNITRGCRLSSAAASSSWQISSLTYVLHNSRKPNLRSRHLQNAYATVVFELIHLRCVCFAKIYGNIVTKNSTNELLK